MPGVHDEEAVVAAEEVNGCPLTPAQVWVARAWPHAATSAWYAWRGRGYSNHARANAFAKRESASFTQNFVAFYGNCGDYPT